MKTLISSLLVAILTISSSTVFAAGAATKKASGSDDAKVLESLKKRYPATTFTSIRKAPIGTNMYEVIMGRNAAYVDMKRPELLLFGHIFDMTKQADLTQARLDEVNVVDFKKLPLDKAIKIVKGDGSREFAVFSDPDCPFCRTLDQTVGQLDNYTMYVFLHPIQSLHPDAVARASDIWCSPEPAKAWKEYMSGASKPQPAPQGCAAPLQAVADAAHALNVQGTPFSVRADGKVAPGALNIGAMEDFIRAGNRISRAVSVTQ